MQNEQPVLKKDLFILQLYTASVLIEQSISVTTTEIQTVEWPKGTKT